MADRHGWRYGWRPITPLTPLVLATHAHYSPGIYIGPGDLWMVRGSKGVWFTASAKPIEDDSLVIARQALDCLICWVRGFAAEPVDQRGWLPGRAGAARSSWSPPPSTALLETFPFSGGEYIHDKTGNVYTVVGPVWLHDELQVHYLAENGAGWLRPFDQWASRFTEA